MNRLIAIFGFAVAAAIAGAQSPFTIVRPPDGAKVREVVKFQVPRNSVPSAGYIGVYVSNRFVEAVMPTERGTFFEYSLDTKKLQLPDGPTKVELVLFVDYNDQPRVVDRSSVTLAISNKSNIPIPEGGLQLRYRFHDGLQTIYNVEYRSAYASISDDAAAKGGKAANLPIDAESYRVEYSVLNAYSNGDGLILTRGLPPAGKKRAFMQTTSDPNGRWIEESEFSQSYLRLNSTGNEVFGAVPPYFPMEGTGYSQNVLNFWDVEPLPTLPVRRVKPGDSWQGRLLFEALDIANIHNQDKLTEPVPARGELLGVEWEMGHPCAKVRQVMTAGRAAKGRLAGRQISLEETFWFALDRGLVEKIIRTATISLDGAGPVFQSGGGGVPGGGSPGATPGSTPGSNPGDGDFVMTGTLNQKGRVPGTGGGGPPGSQYPGPGSGFPSNNQSAGAPTYSPPVTQGSRKLVFQQIFTLQD